MERIRCPNPKCGRHILDIEEMPPGKVVLEFLLADGIPVNEIAQRGNRCP